MALTSLIWVALYVGGLAFAFITPIFGLFAYTFEYYLRPSLNWWGRPLPDFRWSLIAAMVLGLTFLIRRSSLPELKSTTNLALPWLALMAANSLLVNMWAVDPELSWLWSTQFLKHAAVYCLIIGVVRTRWSFDWLISLNIAGILWWGLIALGERRESARLETVGSGDSLGSNLLAAHVLTILPLLVVSALSERHATRRGLALVALPLVVNLMILANSRGAILGVIVTTGLAFLLAGRRQRIPLTIGAVTLAFAFYFLADTQFVRRQQTTTRAADPGAEGRIESWWGALKLVKDYPLGAGGKGFHVLSPVYIPEIVEAHGGSGRSVHNTVLQVTAEWGLQGLFFATGFILSTFYMLRSVRRRAAPRDWFSYRSLGIGLGLIGSLMAGLFTDRYYGESNYWLCALAFALTRIQATELAGIKNELFPAAQPVVPVSIASPRDWRLSPVVGRLRRSSR